MTENVQNSTFDTTNNKWLDVWNEFKNHKGALAGAIIFALIVILVLLGPFVWPYDCLLYTSPSPRDKRQSRMPSSA